jgi:uncharacterized circularly permuted ATP-grasp superfamily protein
MFESDGCPRQYTNLLVQKIESFSDGELIRRQQATERALLHIGVTFNVYGDREGTEKIFPFDIIPRIARESEWEWIGRGLKQRVYALNLFIDDIYHQQKIIKDRVIPEELIRSAQYLREPCMGLNPPHGIWCHISGTDLVRDGEGQIYVLEDNLRCPSGVSYVLENRQVMKQIFPQVFEACSILPVEDYPRRLLDILQYLAPAGTASPTVVVMTPGIYNSAYFEHSFLAQQMGAELVEGRDLVVADGCTLMRTTKGFKRVDVVYRRIGDCYTTDTIRQSDG